MVALLPAYSYSSQPDTVPSDKMLTKSWTDWSAHYDSKEQFDLSQLAIKNHILADRSGVWNEISQSSIAIMHNFEVIIEKRVDYNELAILFACIDNQYVHSNEAIQKYYKWALSRYAHPTSIDDANNRVVAMIGDGKYLELARYANDAVLALVEIGAVHKGVAETDPQYWVKLAAENACNLDTSCRTSQDGAPWHGLDSPVFAHNTNVITYAYINVQTSCHTWGEDDCQGVGYNTEVGSSASATGSGGNAHATSAWLSYHIYGYTTASTTVSASVYGEVGHFSTETDSYSSNTSVISERGALHASGAQRNSDGEYGTYFAEVTITGE